MAWVMNFFVKKVELLTAFREKWLNAPLEWGVSDCLIMTLDWLKALGVLVPEIPTYNDERSAKEAMESMGFKSLTKAIKSLGLKSITVGQAFIGDIVELKTNHRKIRTALSIQLDADLFLVFDHEKVIVCGFSTVYGNDYVFTGNAWRVG